MMQPLDTLPVLKLESLDPIQAYKDGVLLRRNSPSLDSAGHAQRVVIDLPSDIAVDEWDPEVLIKHVSLARLEITGVIKNSWVSQLFAELTQLPLVDTAKTQQLVAFDDDGIDQAPPQVRSSIIGPTTTPQSRLSVTLSEVMPLGPEELADRMARDIASLAERPAETGVIDAATVGDIRAQSEAAFANDEIGQGFASFDFSEQAAFQFTIPEEVPAPVIEAVQVDAPSDVVNTDAPASAFPVLELVPLEEPAQFVQADTDAAVQIPFTPEAVREILSIQFTPPAVALGVLAFEAMSSASVLEPAPEFVADRQVGSTSVAEDTAQASSSIVSVFESAEAVANDEVATSAIAIDDLDAPVVIKFAPDRSARAASVIEQATEATDDEFAQNEAESEEALSESAESEFATVGTASEFAESNAQTESMDNSIETSASTELVAADAEATDTNVDAAEPVSAEATETNIDVAEPVSAEATETNVDAAEPVSAEATETNIDAAEPVSAEATETNVDVADPAFTQDHTCQSSSDEVATQVIVNEDVSVHSCDKCRDLALQSLEDLVVTEPAGEARTYRGRLRAGQVCENREGDLVLVGTVGTGAVVRASGSVHVYGRVTGALKAGQRGDTTARIYAVDFNAQIVDIAGRYQAFENVPAELKGRVVEIWLENDVLLYQAI